MKFVKEAEFKYCLRNKNYEKKIIALFGLFKLIQNASDVDSGKYKFYYDEEESSSSNDEYLYKILFKQFNLIKSLIVFVIKKFIRLLFFIYLFL